MKKPLQRGRTRHRALQHHLVLLAATLVTGPLNMMRGRRNPSQLRPGESSMLTAKDSSTHSVHQLRVTLLESDPPIWRRIQVPSTLTLAKLHRVLQAAMGWKESHLHQFHVGDERFGDPVPGLDLRDARRVKLLQIAPAVGDVLIYEYDFGDSWEHEIVVEEIRDEGGKPRALCLEGARACPPEDCGGVWGYENLLDALADPEHPEHEDMVEWMGGEWDPEAFDRDEVNRALRGIR